MKSIRIRTSDLAKLTGHNTYEPLEKIIKTILNDNNIKECYVPKTNIEESLHKMTKGDLKKIKEELQLSSQCSLKEVESKIKTTIMKDSYSSKIKEEASKENLKKNLEGKHILKTMETSIQHDLQMRRGNIKETQNLNHIEKKTKKVITQRNSKLYSKNLYTDPEERYTLVLKGKVDGQSDGSIIETKNRTKRLFKVLRPYEQVQLEGYMYLTGFNKATLTEHYNEDSFEIDYCHDPEFWSECIRNIVDFMNTHIVPHLQEVERMD
jgi:hypothetical protein